MGRFVVIFGAFFALVPLAIVFQRSTGVPAVRLLDVGAPAMALGEGMTRIGCFLNGCCYGTPTDGSLAVHFPADSFAYRDQIARGLLDVGAPTSLGVHPVQLYSAAIMFAGAGWLVAAASRAGDGGLLARFLLLYGTLRLAVIPFRQEVLASSVAFSIAFVVIGSAGLWRQSPRHALAAG